MTDAFTHYTLGVLAPVALATRHRVPTAMTSKQVGPLAPWLRHLAGPALRAVDLIALREARAGVPLLASGAARVGEPGRGRRRGPRRPHRQRRPS